MNDWYNFFDRVDDNLANSTYRIFEKEHKAEILEWFRREDVGKEQKEAFIQALVNFKDDCGDFYRYRAYFLAAEAINYFKDCSIGDAIALQLLKWSYAYFRQDKTDWQIVPQPLVEAARVALETTDRQRVISAFEHLVHTTEIRTIRRIAAERLGKLDPGNKSAIAALVLLLQVTKDESLLWDITCSLMKIDLYNPAVSSTLISLIQTNTDRCSPCNSCWYMIRNAVDALEKVDAGNQIAVDALIQLIQKMANSPYIGDVIEKLGTIASGNQTAINALVEVIRTTSSMYMRANAISSLGEIAMGSQIAIAALTEFLQTNPEEDFRLYASEALGQIDAGNVAAVATLTEIVQAYQGELFGVSAAKALGKIDAENVTAIDALLKVIETSTDDGSLSYSVCKTLIELKPSASKVITTLTKCIEDSQSDGFNYYTAIGLLQLDPGNLIAISSLINRLKTSENGYELYNIIEYLGDFATGNKNAIAALTKLIDSTKTKIADYTEDGYLLLDAACILGRIDPGNRKAISTLIEFIQSVDKWDNLQNYEWDDTQTDEWDDLEDWQSRYHYQLLSAAKDLQEILLVDQMPQVITALKDYLNKSPQDSSSRYEACYNLIWHCAQNMSYPDFFEAWHKLP